MPSDLLVAVVLVIAAAAAGFAIVSWLFWLFR